MFILKNYVKVSTFINILRINWCVRVKQRLTVYCHWKSYYIEGQLRLCDLILKGAICSKVIELLGSIFDQKNVINGVNDEVISRHCHWFYKFSVVFSQYMQVGVVKPIVHAFVTLKLLYAKRQIECTCWVICLPNLF